ncbi:hypothetical protein [Nonomuraea sp. KM88]|uniref:hypothetical protein n=1 Tax=Nonomuraea sp. KM88 TaxID=3457427 RepID=UPI003FCE0972
MTRSDRPRRWPAYAVAGLFLGYAAGKAAFATQARLGFPGGPPVRGLRGRELLRDSSAP